MPDQERPDPSRRRLLQALLAPALLASCGGGSDGNADGGTVTLSSLTRTSSGDSYDLYVYTPAPSVAKGRTLPVVYVLDGASWITTIASIMDSSQFAAYVVGIGRADLRTRDYLEPGAAGFYDFIVQQLAPFIESNRAVQAGRRVLVGHSYGGVFSALAIFIDRLGAGAFSAYASFDGSFFESTPTAESMDALASFETTLGVRGMTPATLLFAGSPSSNGPYVDAFYQQLLAHAYPGLTTADASYAGGHGPMFAPAYTDAMRRLLAS